MLENATDSVITNFSSMNMLAYIVANIVIFLVAKYWGLSDIRRGNKDPKVQQHYWAFTRDDISKLHVIWCLPFYATFLPRAIITALMIMMAGMTGDLLITDKNDAKFTTQKGLRNCRHSFIKLAIQIACKTIYFMAGYTRTETTFADIDYSEYLGPDWKKEYSGGSTLISNHVSWLDTCFAIVYYFPTIVARESLQKTPFIGSVLRAMATIFLVRTGKDAKESKKAAQK